MAKKAKDTVASVTTKLYDLLEPFGSAERIKAMRAVLTLLGEADTPVFTWSGGRGQRSGSGAGGGGGAGSGGDAQGFFDQKDPKNKIEELPGRELPRET